LRCTPVQRKIFTPCFSISCKMVKFVQRKQLFQDMQPNLRSAFNAQFSAVKYQALIEDIHTQFPDSLDFRVAESPVFVSKTFKEKLISACESIVDVLIQDDFKDRTNNAIPLNQNVPNENQHTSFLAIDFAICEDENGVYVPQLIELQGFPSVFGFQYLLSEMFQKHYAIPESHDFVFGGHTRQSYVEKLKAVILGQENPENVILLEIFPEKQKTRIDFAVTEHLLGVKAVCLTKIQKEGRKLFYELDGQKTEIKRIYNRLIFDDLGNFPDLKADFKLTDDVDVTWVGHPNWFFRISKYTMPFLEHEFVPECRFVSDYAGDFPTNLSDFVLKPLFSFAGSGVKLHISEADLTALPDPENYILQKKVKYVPFLQTLDGSKVKAEIRMLYVWEEDAKRPELLCNLARLSRGEMIGVRFNKDFDWVGGSVSFMEK
jgi:hypothetical protein